LKIQSQGAAITTKERGANDRKKRKEQSGEGKPPTELVWAARGKNSILNN